MHTYLVSDPFGLDALRRVERPVPEPGAGEVLLRMRAVSLNHRDLLVIRGVWRPAGPRVPVSDGVGEVVAVGDGVTRVRVGDRVAANFLPRWIDGEIAPEKLQGPLGGVTTDGVLGEYVRLDAEALVHVPEHLTDEEAATLPCAAVTAWHALVTRGGIREGDTVLVQGTGAVSLFALQFARLHGATAIVTSSSDEKLRRARALGAAHGINYRETPDWERRVLELTGQRGVDHVVEVVGAENVNRSLTALRLGGTISIVGLLGGTRGPVETFDMVEKAARLHGIHIGSRAMFEEMNRAIATHRLRPLVDRVFGFDEAPAALEYMECRTRFGKVVVRVGS